MILYHGTTMDKAKEILDSKRLKCNIKRDFEETLYFSGTTDGYVYRGLPYLTEGEIKLDKKAYETLDQYGANAQLEDDNIFGK